MTPWPDATCPSDVAALSRERCARRWPASAALLGRSLRPGVLGVPAPEGGFQSKRPGLDAGIFLRGKSNATSGNPRRHGCRPFRRARALDAENGAAVGGMDYGGTIAARPRHGLSAAAARRDSQTARSAAGVQVRARSRLPVCFRCRVCLLSHRRATAQLLAGALGLAGLDVVASRSGGGAGLATCASPCTPRARSLVKGQVRPGTFLASVGAASGGKRARPSLGGATVVVDRSAVCRLATAPRSRAGRCSHATSARRVACSRARCRPPDGLLDHDLRLHGYCARRVSAAIVATRMPRHRDGPRVDLGA